jgi:hypothetical protein
MPNHEFYRKHEGHEKRTLTGLPAAGRESFFDCCEIGDVKNAANSWR